MNIVIKKWKKKNIDEHISKCEEIFLDCDYNCGQKIRRKDLNMHKNICLEFPLKCKYREFGCKMAIKRKEIKKHETKEIYNHLELVENKLNNIFDKNDENYKKVETILNDLKKKAEEIERNKEENLNQIKLKEELEENSVSNIWDTKAKQPKNDFIFKNRDYNDEVPFTGKQITFFADIYSSKNNIFFFEKETIKYSGNYYQNLESANKYYTILSSNSLDLNSSTNFQFKIYKVEDRLPWIAFGIYIHDNIANCPSEFPKGGFYCVDLQSHTYYNGDIDNEEKGDYKINENSLITLSYIPKEKYLIIKDSNNFEITFPDIPNDNPSVRLCFSFKGNNRVMIKYDY